MKVLLYSGGLDSACAWWVLGTPPCLYVGGIHGPARWANMGELAALNAQRVSCPEFAGALRQKPLDFRPFMRADEYMMPRDELCMLAAWAEGFDGAMLAWTREDAPTQHAQDVCEKLRAVVPFDFAVSMPVAHLSKAELLAAALEAGAPPDFVLVSHSCVRAATPCGQCKNCRQRHAALLACKLA